MKSLFLASLLLAVLCANAQISTQGFNGSIVITPKGLQGSTNSIESDNTNVSLGAFALQSNLVGYQNTAIGYNSLNSNTQGGSNTATGVSALNANTSGSGNNAFGSYSLKSNTTGIQNVAMGNSTLYLNRTGQLNTAIGSAALYSNTTGEQNTAIGHNAMQYNNKGFWNVAIGGHAGSTIIDGKSNTFLGMGADAIDDFTNSMAIGAYTKVDANNKVRIGNANVTAIEGQVAWSNPSDRRLKENIVYSNRLGLDFINRLQTVSYNYIADQSKIRYDGFIAQDIEQVMKDLNIPFSGLKKSENGTYSLAYSDFVMPLVNAVKEQQSQIEELKKQVQAMIKVVNKQ